MTGLYGYILCFLGERETAQVLVSKFVTPHNETKFQFTSFSGLYGRPGILSLRIRRRGLWAWANGSENIAGIDDGGSNESDVECKVGLPGYEFPPGLSWRSED